MMRSGGGRMPGGVGVGGVDLRQIIGNIVNFAKSKTLHAPTAPCDGFVLKLHYRWTFWMFLASFLTVWYNWYHRETITCVSHFNADTQVRLDYINICLSYPYIEYEDESRRYLLYYRWVPYVFLFLGAMYYIPRKLSKNIENPKLKKLIEDLYQNAHRIDAESQIVDHAAKYLTYNMKTHNGLYSKFIFLNVAALMIDIAALHVLDFILQGYFLRYGINAYPFERDPKLFTDYMSTMFPPFASCQLEKTHQLTAARKEKLGCHLTLMELYEKIFLFIWAWIILLIIVTTIYLICNLLIFTPCFKRFILRTAKPMNHSESVRHIIDKVSRISKIGDVYLLYRIKQHVSPARFYELMLKLSNPDNYKSHLPITKSKEDGLKFPPGKPQMDNLRNRKGPPPSYSDNTELENLINKSKRSGTPTRNPTMNKNDRSILIE